jgi:hypothetical protein
MGGGKGKSRRVRSVTLSSQPAQVLTEKWTEWQEFVWGSKMGDVQLHEYYLGTAPEELTSEDYEKLLTELFSDAVAVGAIALPDPYRPDDFAFRIVGDKSTNVGWRRDADAEIVLKSEPDSMGVFEGATRFMDQNYTLTCSAVDRSICHIANGVSDAIASRNGRSGPLYGKYVHHIA